MCRILLKTKSENDQKLSIKCLNLMKHGGPDSTRYLEYDDIFFGHNRLAIIDPRPIADQPMIIDGNVILFNGEIYNHKKLKEDHKLDPKTGSDTEVILLLYNKYGDEAFKYLDGEFAIVIYDAEKEHIKLVRDSYGIKHLYWTDFNDELVVSSEIKAILPFIGDPNAKNIDEWLTNGYTTDIATMYDDVNKVEPNTILTLNKLGRILSEKDLMVEYEKTEEKSLFDVIQEAVKKRMMSDVDVSCTLSGGLDSSIVAYFMRKESSTPIKTYTVGFEGAENEFKEARFVSDLLGTDHTEVLVTLDEVMENIDDIVKTMEEPIDRGSLIPTYFLAKAINEKVTLIGEGADELFAGYSRHKWLYRNPSATFEEYFNSQLKSFKNDLYTPTNQTGILDWDNKNSALIYDLQNEIPNYHTVRIDKCMMRFGVEARVPFLDISVVEKALSIPFEDKQNPEKKALREAFRGILPDSIVDRPKKALKFPFELLLKKEEVVNLIDENNDPDAEEMIENLFKSLETDKNAARDLWNIFLLKKWIKLNQFSPEKWDQ